MPEKSFEVLNLVGTIIVSVISGVVSITRRLAKGQTINLLWVISEFLTAILSGYLMYTAYPAIQGTVPEWFTMPIAVAVAAHMGGRFFQEFEEEALRYYRKILPPEN